MEFRNIRITAYFQKLVDAPAIDDFILVSCIVVVANFIIGFTIEEKPRNKNQEGKA